MRRYGRFRYGPRFGRPWRPFGGLIWLILFGMLFFGIHMWPVILILIVLGVLFSIGFHSGEPHTPPPPPMPFPPPAAPTMAPMPAAPFHRVDLLPINCPQCGGPIRSYEVKWTGAQSASCPFCGSNLPMKKQ